MKVFKSLTRKRKPLEIILKSPDKTDYEFAQREAEELAEQEPEDDQPPHKVIIADSRFSDVWFRILAHIAADETKNKQKHLISHAETSLEEWEAYCADLIWRAVHGDEYVDACYKHGIGFPLF